MSQENVEVVRRGSAAFNRGDYEGLAESRHPDIEFRDHAHAADAPEALKGRHAVLSLLAEWRESFDDFRAEISEYIAHSITLRSRRQFARLMRRTAGPTRRSPSQSSPGLSGSVAARSQAESWYRIIAIIVGSAISVPEITAAASE